MRMSFWRWSISSIPLLSLAMHASLFPATTGSLASFTADFTCSLCLYCYSCPFFSKVWGSGRRIFFSSLICVFEDSSSCLFTDSNLLSMMDESFFQHCWLLLFQFGFDCRINARYKAPKKNAAAELRIKKITARKSEKCDKSIDKRNSGSDVTLEWSPQ